jgi:hypothetical protein
LPTGANREWICKAWFSHQTPKSLVDKAPHPRIKLLTV